MAGSQDKKAPDERAPGLVANASLAQQELNAEMAQRLYELKVEDVKRRIEIEKERLAMGGIGDAYHAMKPTAVTPEFIFKVRPAVNGGFVLMMDNDMFIAANAEELAKTVVTAMVRKKIFSGL